MQDNPATIFFLFLVPFLCLKMCMYGVVRVPRGQGGGGRHLASIPLRGGRGPASLGWGGTRDCVRHSPKQTVPFGAMHGQTAGRSRDLRHFFDNVPSLPLVHQ